MAVRKYVEDEEMFLANYADGLTDLHLPDMIDTFEASDKVASFMAVPPSQSFHLVDVEDDGEVASLRSVTESDLLINGGFFALRHEIFDYIYPGDELVLEPFARLIKERKLLGYRYDRFWVMDTFKEQQQLSDLADTGCAPWEVWKTNGNGASRTDAPAGASTRRRVAGYELLCLGAHSDDLEIGCSGTVLRWLRGALHRADHLGRAVGQRRPGLRGAAQRARDRPRPPPRCSRWSHGSRSATATSRTRGAPIKDFFESLKREVQPDVVLTHYREDRHQDHRLVSELTYNTFRDHLDPRVRGDEARRRSRPAERLRLTRRRRSSTARSST